MASDVQTRPYSTVAVGAAVCVVCVPVAYLLYRHCKGSGVSYFTIKLLTRESVMRVTREIREQYSQMYLQLRYQSRTQRRHYDRSSCEYRDCISELSNSTKRILEKSSQLVFHQYHIDENLLDDSIAYFEGDQEVSAAAESMCEVLNNTQCPASLTAEKLREVFQYYLQRLSEEDEAEDDYMLKAAVISDEIWENYGYESEEIDMAYQKYKDFVEDIALQIKEMTREALDNDSV